MFDLPPLNDDGDLPPGVYPVTLSAALTRFGVASQQRVLICEWLSRIHQLAKSTNRLARFVVFGSFVSAKSDPRDIDIVMIMEDSFNLESVPTDAATIFRHDEAESSLGASVFWTKRSGAFGGEQAMVEYWQIRREGGYRGILEIVPEQP